MNIIQQQQHDLKKFWLIKFRRMCSLGSFSIKDYRNILPGTWWYEFTFMFIEITWGYMQLPKK